MTKSCCAFECSELLTVDPTAFSAQLEDSDRVRDFEVVAPQFTYAVHNVYSILFGLEEDLYDAIPVCVPSYEEVDEEILSIRLALAESYEFDMAKVFQEAHNAGLFGVGCVDNLRMFLDHSNLSENFIVGMLGTKGQSVSPESVRGTPEWQHLLLKRRKLVSFEVVAQVARAYVRDGVVDDVAFIRWVARMPMWCANKAHDFYRGIRVGDIISFDRFHSECRNACSVYDSTRYLSLATKEGSFNPYGNGQFDDEFFADDEAQFVVPVALHLYHLSRCRDSVSATLTLFGFADTIAHDSRFGRFRTVGAGWITQYLKLYDSVVSEHLNVILSGTTSSTELQSTESILDHMFNTAVEIKNNAYVHSFVWMISFLFATVGAATIGVYPDFNKFSKEASSFVNMISGVTSTGMTVSLFATAAKHCAAFISKLFVEGPSALWSTELKNLADMTVRARTIADSLAVANTVTEYAVISTLGRELHGFLKDFEALAPKYSGYRRSAVGMVGSTFSTEANTAMMFENLKKLHASIKAGAANFDIMLVGCSFRPVPFTFCAVGGSSVAKSLFVQYLGQIMCRWLGFKEVATDMIYTLNPAQKYMDGYRSWQPVVLLDDMATMRPEYCAEGDPQVCSLIQFVNNCALLTNQADLARKETTPFLSKIVMMTSNSVDLNAHKYADNDAAILRRVKYQFHLEVAQEFATETGMLDSGKAALWTRANGGELCSFPPFWKIKVVEITVNNSHHDKSKYYMSPVFTEVVNGGAGEFMHWLRGAWDKHWDLQTMVVEQVKDIGTMRICEHCHMPRGVLHTASCPDSGVMVQSDQIGAVVLARLDHFAWVYALIGAAWQYDVIGHLIWFIKVSAAYWWKTYVFYMWIVSVIQDAIDGMYKFSVLYSRCMRPLGFVCATLGVFCHPVAFVYPFVLWLSANMTTARTKKSFAMLKIFAGLAGLGALAYYINRQRRRKNQFSWHEVREQGAVESSTDFSAYDKAVSKWGHGVAVPYTREQLAVHWSPASKCAAGSSHDGVVKALERSVCRVLIEPDLKPGVVTRAVGVVMKNNTSGFPYVLVNDHSLQSADGGSFKLTLVFSGSSVEVDIGSSDDRIRDAATYKIEAHQVVRNSPKDLAIIHTAGLRRRGAYEYVVLDGHSNYNCDPMLVGRDNKGHISKRCVNYRSTLVDKMLGEGGPKWDKVVTYATDSPTVGGESGSLYLVHAGDRSKSIMSCVGIAGMHSGLLDGEIGFSTVFTKGVLDAMENQCRSQCRAVLSANLPQDPVLTGLSTQAEVFGICETEDRICDLQLGSVGGSLGPTHHKAAVTWLNKSVGQPNMTINGKVFGSIVGDSRTSQGTKSHIRPAAWTHRLSKMESSVFGSCENKYCPAVVPPDRLYLVHQNTIRDLMCGEYAAIPTSILDAATYGYVSDVIKGVAANGKNHTWSLIRPLTSLDENVNGRDGIFDGICKKTGGGFGFSGPKRLHMIHGLVLEHLTSTTPPHVRLDSGVVDSINEADDLLRRGVDPGFVYTCHLKSEVRSVSKIENCEVRMICGASIPAIVLMRKYLLGVVLFMASNPFVTECAVGLNADSAQWSQLAEHLQQFGGDDRYVAGDYKNFDKGQNLSITMACSKAIWLMVCHANNLYNTFNAGDLVAIRTLLFGLCYPIYDHFGTLLEVNGTNPSGNSLTAQKNCISNSIYIRSVWIVLAGLKDVSVVRAVQDYSKCVRQINYGDDLVLAVRKGFGWFNHDTIADQFGKWNIVFTHADKSLEIGREYERFTDVTFLKRTWVYNDELQGYLSPLDPASIVKSLHYVTLDATTSVAQAHIVAAFSAVNLCFGYGEEKFAVARDEIVSLVLSCGFSEIDLAELNKLPVWSDYVTRWRSASCGNQKVGALPDPIRPY